MGDKTREFTHRNLNKIGIAAGIMRDCDYDDVKAKIAEGWKFMEFGTVTNEPNEPEGIRKHVLLGKKEDSSWNNYELRSVGGHKFIENYEKCRQMLIDAQVEVNINVHYWARRVDDICMIYELLEFEEVRIIVNCRDFDKTGYNHMWLNHDTCELNNIIDKCFPECEYYNEDDRIADISRRFGVKIPYIDWREDKERCHLLYYALKAKYINYVIISNSYQCDASGGEIGGRCIWWNSECVLNEFLNARTLAKPTKFPMKIVSCGGILGSYGIGRRFEMGADAVQICTAILMGKTYEDLIRDKPDEYV